MASMAMKTQHWLWFVKYIFHRHHNSLHQKNSFPGLMISRFPQPASPWHAAHTLPVLLFAVGYPGIGLGCQFHVLIYHLSCTASKMKVEAFVAFCFVVEINVVLKRESPYFPVTFCSHNLPSFGKNTF